MARFARPLIALLSTGICLIASEGIVRLFVDPVNFLRPTLIEDPVLRWHVRGGSGGHDAWGFRNESVPSRAHIVAVGDSQTYGNGARRLGERS